MWKKIVTLSLIYSLLLLSIFSTGVYAQQTQQNTLKNETLKVEPIQPKTETAAPQTNVKKLFAADTDILKTDTSVKPIDFKKLENTERKQAAKSKWSKKEKTWIVVFIIALVVGATLLAIYGKVPKCSEVSCNPDYDEGCYCDED